MHAFALPKCLSPCPTGGLRPPLAEELLRVPRHRRRQFVDVRAAFHDQAGRRMDDVEVRELVKKFGRYARENPGVVLGALCALAVGGTAVVGSFTFY